MPKTTDRTMARIDIYKFIDDHGLERKEVENLLFPTAKHPYYALNRIARGEGLLDSEQLYKLAELAGVSVSALYDHKKWKQRKNVEGKTLVFENGEYKAILNRETWITKIFQKDAMFHESVVTPATTTLTEYFSELDRIVEEHSLE